VFRVPAVGEDVASGGAADSGGVQLLLNFLQILNLLLKV